MFFSKKKEFKLSPTQELLLALLRAQLWLKPVDDITLPSTIEEWDELINLGYKQTVICFVARACLRHPKVNGIPTDVREEFDAVLEENTKIHKYHNDVIIELILKFEEQGLHPILLKGQGIAQMYPEPELRQCGDIDLYFLSDEFARAVEFTKSIQDKNAVSHNQYKHYETCFRGIELEIHQHTTWFANPFANSYYLRFTEGFVKDYDFITVNNKKVSIPVPMYNYVMIFTHMWHHFEKGDTSIRQLCDVMLCMQYYQDKIDRSSLTFILRKLYLLSYWNITNILLSNYMGYYGTCCKTNKGDTAKANILLTFAFQKGKYQTRSPKNVEISSHCWYKKKMGKHLFGLKQALRFYPVSGINILWYFINYENIIGYQYLRKFLVRHCL